MKRESSRLRACLVLGLLLVAMATSLPGCGQSQSSSTSSLPLTSTPSPSAMAATATTASTTTTTTPEPYVDTTSPALGTTVSQGMGMVQQLGDAVISYLSGNSDLASVQALLAPPAQDGLDRMLHSLDQPTSCKVMVMSHYGSSDETEADLLFVGGTVEPTHFYVTILVDPDTGSLALTAISPDPTVNPYEPGTTTRSTTVTTILEGGATGSSVPVIQIQTEFKFDYMSYFYSYFTAETVVLGTVVEELPFRRNPLAGAGDPDGGSEAQPIVYKGYVLEVERAYGLESIPKRITVYALGNGTVELDGVTYEVRDDFPLDADAGDRLFLPLMKVAYFGTPALGADEYWVQANWAAFAVDGAGHCTRVAGAEVDPETRSEFPLSFLEDAAVEQGKEPSVVR